jgi:hypothetical protein
MALESGDYVIRQYPVHCNACFYYYIGCVVSLRERTSILHYCDLLLMLKDLVIIDTRDGFHEHFSSEFVLHYY